MKSIHEINNGGVFLSSVDEIDATNAYAKQNKRNKKTKLGFLCFFSFLQQFRYQSTTLKLIWDYSI